MERRVHPFVAVQVQRTRDCSPQSKPNEDVSRASTARWVILEGIVCVTAAAARGPNKRTAMVPRIAEFDQSALSCAPGFAAWTKKQGAGCQKVKGVGLRTREKKATRGQNAVEH
ncbi:Hypothetical protein, putative [Bodo saltans]|uniref:Uncharacterized protein n=1 Tax=Bodo saltans TaxID=75058 RepID=A0A0S4JL43_BODSA|nr:Hypothetical protein, putative [Bodo saltans]|eukprot:CUG91113.1 Hypothetical protein, putative [Bodo saltans]